MSVLPSAPAPVPGACRSDFPLLQEVIQGRKLVYLDNAATTQKPETVLRRLDAYYRHENSNVHRGMYPLSRRATLAYESARQTVARFIGAASEREIVFTRGTTEGMNLVAQAWGSEHLKPGDRILVGEFEHHSTLVPWHQAARRTGAELVPIPLNEDFSGPDEVVLKAALADPRTKVFAFTLVSNSLGITLDAERWCRESARHRVLTVVDAAQAVGHLPVDVRNLGCDFLAFSGHKCAGPTGIGVLYGREEALASLQPWQGGGEMIDRVTFEEITWKPAPFRFEAGTPAIAQAIGLAAALDYLSSMGLEAIRQHTEELGAYALEKLREISGIRFLSPAPVAGPLVSFNLSGIHAHDAADLAGEAGVALRAGHHCCQPLMKRCGVPGTLRASWYVYNSRDDIDALVTSLGDIQTFFRKNR
ncbi:MAG: aminotransferase class V-fold PLP-dependent enzyme [Candidatus Methylacidiphilales bacterium]